MRRRRACKRACQRRAAQQESKEVQVAVDMQEMAQMPVMPMGYYYAPNGQVPYMPQYVPVSMQQMPQPVFVPAQPE